MLLEYALRNYLWGKYFTMESLEDYKQEIENMIRSGFYGPQDIQYRMEGIGLDQQELNIFVNDTFARHQAQGDTSEDFQKLASLFDELSKEGYIALHNAGYTTSDAYGMIDDVLAESDFKPYGYLLYHEQDMNRCIESGELTMSFGAFRDTEQTQSSGKNKQETGVYFKEKLEALGLKVQWDGSPDQKLSLVSFNFHKRYNEEENWSYTRCLNLLNTR